MEFKLLSIEAVKDMMYEERVANFQFYIDAALNELRPSLYVYNPISASVDPFAKDGDSVIKTLKGFFDAYSNVENCTIQLVQQNAGRKPIWGAIPYLNAEVFVVSNANAKKQFALSFPITDIVCDSKKLKEKLLNASGSLYVTNKVFAFLAQSVYVQVEHDSRMCTRCIATVLSGLSTYSPSDSEAAAFAKRNNITIFDWEDTTAVEVTMSVPKSVLMQKATEVAV
jgi:hypothetical protein